MDIEKITLDHLDGDQLELAKLIGIEAEVLLACRQEQVVQLQTPKETSLH
ncbi:MAG: hypothetical protein NC320_08735 [Clostridium sp.]|nr:hypothetical protein [Clostridium sp.]